MVPKVPSRGSASASCLLALVRHGAAQKTRKLGMRHLERSKGAGLEVQGPEEVRSIHASIDLINRRVPVLSLKSNLGRWTGEEEQALPHGPQLLGSSQEAQAGGGREELQSITAQKAAARIWGRQARLRQARLIARLIILVSLCTLCMRVFWGCKMAEERGMVYEGGEA